MRTWLVTAGVLLCLLQVGCSSTSTGPEQPSELEFPLAVGNWWEYDVTAVTTTSYPSGVPPDTTRWSLRTEVTDRETLPNSVVAYELQWTESFGGWDSVSREYLRNETDGLFLHALWSLPPSYRHSDAFCRNHPLWSSQPICANDVGGSPARMDSLECFDPPRLVLPYPVTVGQQWIYIDLGDWRVDRRVERETELSVPLGDYDCYEIRVLYDLDGDGEWDDSFAQSMYYARCGMVAMWVLWNDVTYTDEWGEIIRIVDVDITTELAANHEEARSERPN